MGSVAKYAEGGKPAPANGALLEGTRPDARRRMASQPSRGVPVRLHRGQVLQGLQRRRVRAVRADEPELRACRSTLSSSTSDMGSGQEALRAMGQDAASA